MTEQLTQDSLFVKMIITAWQQQNKRIDNLIETITDEQLLKETAPGRNTGIYLLGHLTAINDALFKLLGISERMHAELDDAFVNNPDKSGKEMPPVNTLKEYWKEVNNKLTEKFNALQPDDWFKKHTAVSEEDFAKEPHRNRLNVLITRTTHQSYHLGQMNYLKPGKE